MSTTPVHLDWRNAPSTDEVVDRVFKLLQDISRDARAKMLLSGSMTGPKGAELKHVDNDGNIVDNDSTEPATRMFIWEGKSTMKRAVDYLLKLGVVADRLLQDIDKGVPVPQRLFGYYWTHKTLSRVLAYSLATDIALTIDVHPYVLGVVPEVNGRFALPHGWTIRFRVCENILDRDASGSLKLANLSVSGPSTDAPVPALIQSLELQRKPNSISLIRAVLVFEHRNIKFMFNSLVNKDDVRFKDIIVISTGGFPDRGTREFLKLLLEDGNLKDVPCIFISDRDPHAAEIFSVLKYGSRFNAFESRITAVNKIQWGGVSIRRYRQIADEWPETALQDFNRRNPQSSEADRENELKRLEKITKQTMIQTLKQPSALLNAADKNRLTHFFNFNNFSTVHDPELYADLLAMGMNPLGSPTAVSPDAVGEKFSLAKLSHLDNFGIEKCVASIMTDMSVAAVGSTSVGQEQTESLKRAWNDTGVSPDPRALKRVQTQDDTTRSRSETVEAVEDSGTIEASVEQSSRESGSMELSDDQVWEWDLVQTELDHVFTR